MAEGLVSAVLEQRASILIQQVEAEVRLVVGVEYEVQNVTTNFTAIKAALEEAEDVLDEWIENASKINKNVRSFIPAYRFSPKQLVLCRDIADRKNPRLYI
ncbi:hypothetical protein AB3S75_001606 [Citrus x aurantiifolia]